MWAPSQETLNGKQCNLVCKHGEWDEVRLCAQNFIKPNHTVENPYRIFSLWEANVGRILATALVVAIPPCKKASARIRQLNVLCVVTDGNGTRPCHWPSDRKFTQIHRDTHNHLSSN